MIKVNEKNCTGCKACEAVCPQKCITVTENTNGFLVATVDQTRCLNCERCGKVCPVNNAKYNEVIDVYAVYSKSDESYRSASGGLFYELAKNFILNNGIVFGAAYTEKNWLKIVSVDSINDLSILQGTKYFQADTDGSYLKVKEMLRKGNSVLYSGTPCQIAGLKNYIGKNDINLFTVEIICHGVPSPRMFQDYLEWMNKKRHKKIASYQFRTKRKKGRDFHCSVRYDDSSEEIISGFKDPFYKHFMKADVFREVCYECPFSQEKRVADITVGDFWNIEDVDVGFGLDKRVSVALINTEKGMTLWKNAVDNLVYIQTDMKIAIKGNSNLVNPTKKPQSYIPYGEIEDKYNFFETATKEKGNVKKEFFNMLPVKIRRSLKKIL